MTKSFTETIKRVNGMGIWSVDSVTEKGQGREGKQILLRFVHYNNDVERTPAVRYCITLQTKRNPFQWGQAYRITWPRTTRLVREDRTIVIDRPSDFEEVREIEERLRQDGERAFANVPPGEGDGLVAYQNSRPLENKRGKKKAVWAKIHVHRVGQGDTIVLELPNDQLWLVDARLYSAHRRDQFKKWISNKFNGRDSFDKVIVTHLHYDHIHSIPFILNEYNVDEVIVPDSLVHPTASAQRVWQLAGKRLRNAAGGRQYRFGELNVQMTQTSDLQGHNTASKDPNDHEIAIVMKTDQSTGFLAGDIPANMCETIIGNANILNNSDRFYKVSHHGSRTGYSNTFYNAYPANEAIISCGIRNRYKHPHDPPLSCLNMHNLKITYRDGSDVYTYPLQ